MQATYECEKRRAAKNWRFSRIVNRNFAEAESWNTYVSFLYDRMRQSGIVQYPIDRRLFGYNNNNQLTQNIDLAITTLANYPVD